MNSRNLTVLKLTEAVKAIAAGHFDARVFVTTHNETGALADAFNQMADTLEKHLSVLRCTNDELEQRVKERTVELTAEIAERKRAEKELYQLHHQHQLVLNGVGEGIHALDTQGRIIFENPLSAKMLGWEVSELTGKPAHATMHHSKASGASYSQCECPIYATLQDGISRRISDEVFWRKDGTSFPVEYVAAPIRDENGEIIGTVVVFSDITERKRAEVEMHNAKTAKTDAEASNRAKSEFLATMSHEIRTPMNGVIGMTELLLSTELSPEQLEYAETIRTSAESLLRIINDLLDLSKIESGRLELEVLDFDLLETIESTIEIVTTQAQAKGIELLSLVEPDVPMRVRGDAGRVRQVLTNVLGNAVKFTDRGEISLRVNVQTQTQTEALLQFEVKDTGIGISPEAQARIFQAFVQADGSTTRKFGGTGLGLVICQRLVDKMGGKICVESTPGKGSIFRFTLRLAKQSNARLRISADHQLAHCRVLIVDDNETSGQFLHDQILSWNMRNGIAQSGPEALQMLRRAAAERDPYTFSIIDMHMPEMDGLALARAIKSDPALAATRLIMLMPFGKTLSEEELRSAGIAAFCSKPVRQSTLFDCLSSAMVSNELAPKASNSITVTVPTTTTRLRCRILIVEDNRDNQMVALGQLKTLGYDAEIAVNGHKAVEALQSGHYDAVLMDIQMPEMDGFETTAEIRRREGNGSHTWIIAMTANAMSGDRERCLAAGTDDYVSKPTRTNELGAALERALSRPEKPVQ